VPLLTRTLRLRPGNGSLLPLAMDQFRWYYNLCVDLYENCRKEMGRVSYIGLRGFLGHVRLVKEKGGVPYYRISKRRTLWPRSSEWESTPHNRIVRGAIKQFVGAYRSSRAQHAENKFELGYREKKNFQLLFFDDKNYPKWIDRLPGFYREGRKKTPWRELPEAGARGLTIDKKWGRYYLHLPMTVPPITQPKPTERVIALDPGVRNFLVGYSPNGLATKIGAGFAQRYLASLEEEDYLRARLTHLENLEKKEGQQPLRRRIRNMQKRHYFLLRNFHYQVARYLVGTARVILLPTFPTSKLVRHKSTGRKTHRALSRMAHYRFQQRLLFSAQQRGVQVHLVSEAFTSKTCSRCGFLHRKLGSADTFACPACSHTIDRDLNASRNILIRFLVSTREE